MQPPPAAGKMSVVPRGLTRLFLSSDDMLLVPLQLLRPDAPPLSLPLLWSPSPEAGSPLTATPTLLREARSARCDALSEARLVALARADDTLRALVWLCGVYCELALTLCCVYCELALTLTLEECREYVWLASEYECWLPPVDVEYTVD